MARAEWREKQLMHRREPSFCPRHWRNNSRGNKTAIKNLVSKAFALKSCWHSMLTSFKWMQMSGWLVRKLHSKRDGWERTTLPLITGWTGARAVRGAETHHTAVARALHVLTVKYIS